MTTTAEKLSWLRLARSENVGRSTFFRLLKVAGPIYYSLVGGVVVLTGLFWGRVFYNEHLNIWSGIAVVLILSAIIIMSAVRRGKYVLEKKE